MFSFLRSEVCCVWGHTKFKQHNVREKPLAAGTHWEVRGPIHQKETDLGYLQTDWTERQLRRCFPQHGEDWFNGGKMRESSWCFFAEISTFLHVWIVRKDWHGQEKYTEIQEEGCWKGENCGRLWHKDAKSIFVAREKSKRHELGEWRNFILKLGCLRDKSVLSLSAFQKCLNCMLTENRY